MRTLIYKRTHCGDPAPQAGVFGNHDCMGKVREWEFDAVIGIGGIGREAKSNGIAGRLTWVGIGAHKIKDHRVTGEVCHMPDTSKGGSDGSGPRLLPLYGPLVTFNNFRHYGEKGPLLEVIAPHLAKRMCRRFGPRTLMDSLSSEERKDVETILRLAENAPPSSQRAEQDIHDTSGKCPSTSCGV